MTQHPQLLRLLEAALAFWRIDATVSTVADGSIVRCGQRVVEIHADTDAQSGWWLYIDEMPRVRTASVSAALREIRLELDPGFSPGKAIIGARDSRA